MPINECSSRRTARSGIPSKAVEQDKSFLLSHPETSADYRVRHSQRYEGITGNDKYCQLNLFDRFEQRLII